jgi:hypothetical protein
LNCFIYEKQRCVSHAGVEHSNIQRTKTFKVKLPYTMLKAFSYAVVVLAFRTMYVCV